MLLGLGIHSSPGLPSSVWGLRGSCGATDGNYFRSYQSFSLKMHSMVFKQIRLWEGLPENVQIPRNPFFRGFSLAQGPRQPKRASATVGSAPASVTEGSLLCGPRRIRPANTIPMETTWKLMGSLRSPSSSLFPVGVRPEYPPSPQTNKAFIF